jgi:hypothetical protein
LSPEERTICFEIVGMLKETVKKQPGLVKAIRSHYGDAVQVIKNGQDEDFFKSKAKECSI